MLISFLFYTVYLDCGTQIYTFLHTMHVNGKQETEAVKKIERKSHKIKKFFFSRNPAFDSRGRHLL